MKHILLFLFISTGLLAQTPRLNLKQLAKDTTFGSVLISTPSDSGIVFSRDFYISYGADTVLILYGDTVGVGATLDAEQVQDIVGAMANAGLGIDITYNDTDGELLFESLSIEDSIKNETGTLIPIGTPLYATGVQGNYWTVAPADASDPTKLPVVVIAGENIADGATGLGLIKGHIKGVNTGDFTAGDEIWLASGGGYTNIEPKGGGVYSQSLGTVIKVDATDGSGIINIQEPHQTLAPDYIFIGGADSLITSTEYIVDSTRINATGDTAYYYQNGVLIGTGAIAGGGTTYNNITEGNDTVFISDYLDVDTSTLYVDATNNRVGIGTTSPNTKLMVEGTQGNLLQIKNSNYNGSFVLGSNSGSNFYAKLEGFTDSLNSLGAVYIASMPDYSDTLISGRAVTIFQSREYTGGTGSAVENANAFAFNNYATNLMTIAANGNVGIGTTSPSKKLDVVGQGQISGDTYPLWLINRDNRTLNGVWGTTTYRATKTSALGDGFGAALSFQVANPTNVYDIGDIGFYRSGNDSTGAFQVRTYNDGVVATRMVIDSSGNVGIGTTSPSYPLEMGSGAHVTTGGTWTNASDIKLKTNINYIYPYGLSEVLNLKPVVFDYINGEKNTLGFIAQDVFEYIPEAISSTIDDNGNETMGLKMVSITSTLTKAIQEQQTIIESQASEIEQLKTLITELSNRLQILENN